MVIGVARMRVISPLQIRFMGMYISALIKIPRRIWIWPSCMKSESTLKVVSDFPLWQKRLLRSIPSSTDPKHPQTEEGVFCATTCVPLCVCCPFLSSDLSGLFQVLIFKKSYVKILQSGFEIFQSWLVGTVCPSHDHGLPWVYSPLSKPLGFENWSGLTCIGWKRCNPANEILSWKCDRMFLLHI